MPAQFCADPPAVEAVVKSNKVEPFHGQLTGIFGFHKIGRIFIGIDDGQRFTERNNRRRWLANKRGHIVAKSSPRHTAFVADIVRPPNGRRTCTCKI